MLWLYNLSLNWDQAWSWGQSSDISGAPAGRCWKRAISHDEWFMFLSYWKDDSTCRCDLTDSRPPDWYEILHETNKPAPNVYRQEMDASEASFTWRNISELDVTVWRSPAGITVALLLMVTHLQIKRNKNYFPRESSSWSLTESSCTYSVVVAFLCTIFLPPVNG